MTPASVLGIQTLPGSDTLRRLVETVDAGVVGGEGGTADDVWS